jgi:hypothetical protein
MLESGSTWRQGQVLKHEDAVSLKLLDAEDTAHKIIMITHDCDIQNDEADSVLEFIKGKLVQLDGNFSNAKHPRTLHLALSDEIHDGYALELTHEQKFLFERAIFAADEADKEFAISPIEKQALKQWLAARYGRPAFPDIFEKRLRMTENGKGNLIRSIAKVVEKNAKFIVGIFFDLGEDRHEELDDETPYELHIRVVYDSVEGAGQGRENAENICKEITAKMHAIHGKPDESKTIALESCLAVSDQGFSLYDLRRMDQWRVEYISLRPATQGDFIGPAI